MAYVPFVALPLFRAIYDKTLEDLPATIIMVTGVLYIITSGLYFYLFSEKKMFYAYAQENHVQEPVVTNILEKEDEIYEDDQANKK